MPYLNDFRGYAVYVDGDMIMNADINNILCSTVAEHAVSVVKQETRYISRIWNICENTFKDLRHLITDDKQQASVTVTFFVDNTDKDSIQACTNKVVLALGGLFSYVDSDCGVIFDEEPD